MIRLQLLEVHLLALPANDAASSFLDSTAVRFGRVGHGHHRRGTGHRSRGAGRKTAGTPEVLSVLSVGSM